MKTAFDHYLLKLRETPVKQQTEHTSRSALEALLNHYAGLAEAQDIRIQHEPKKVQDKGAPDFKVGKPGTILGYVEVKEIGANLDKVLKSDQIRRYRELSDNIILTDYLHFIWIGPDGVRARETLVWPSDLEERTVRLKQENAQAVDLLLRSFFSQAPQGIGRSQQLALALATRSRLLRDFLGEELLRQGKENTEGRLHGLYDVFRTQVFHELSASEFADAFAQMLAYGLFLARLNAGADETVTLENVRSHIPGSFRLIRELVRFIEEMNEKEYREIRWVVEEVLSIVNGLDLGAIATDLSFRQRKAVSRKVRAGDEEEHRLFEKDPFIYFYEDFLKAYDAATRKGRGVYYTPPPVVNFIVRAIDDLLKRDFDMPDGLADHKRVTVLDFACGTGTFLLEVFQRIFDQIGGADSGRADPIVREHILKNLYGFEYLIAPYTIAHLKLSQFLQDRGHPLQDGERLQVFLTNTLEPVDPQRNAFLPALSAEVEAAQTVKDRPILVITGNPPYSGHSRNNGATIKAAIDGYKYTVETDAQGREFRKPLGERNPKYLNDDYVKFIRFAQLKMDAVEEGIVGIITNHSWLDNPTFRGMRQSLMRSFDQLHVLDLHGNNKKKEKAPDGGKDENVFDIEQGVAIALFVKRKGLEKGIFRGDLWGRRLDKYKAAAEGDIATLPMVRIAPVAPDYLFVEQDATLKQEYRQGWSIPEMFPVNVMGFKTHRDDFAISFTEGEMREKLRVFADPAMSDEELKRLYGVVSNRDWSLPESRTGVRAATPVPLTKVSYRPFDERWCEFGDLTMDYPRRELLDHVLGRENICLLSPRQLGTTEWRHAFVACAPPNDCLVSNRTKEANQVFPLWTFKGNERLENLSPAFRAAINALHDTPPEIEDIFGCIYAILHAPAYRARYGEFLRRDFPRIPFTADQAHFETLAKLGRELADVHLLRRQLRKGLGAYHGKGRHSVEKPVYDAKRQAVHINADQYFAPVPEAVWQFHIGGYPVVEKYLKSRKDRTLSLDEISHVAVICDALAFTISQMERIDAAWRVAFPDRV